MIQLDQNVFDSNYPSIQEVETEVVFAVDLPAWEPQLESTVSNICKPQVRPQVAVQVVILKGNLYHQRARPPQPQAKAIQTIEGHCNM